MSCVMPPIPYKRKADEHLKPLYELDEKQREVLEQFRQTMNDVTGKEKLWADDACLIRYLRARDYQIAAAEKLLRGTLSWRRTYGIETVNPDEIDEGTSALLSSLLIHFVLSRGKVRQELPSWNRPEWASCDISKATQAKHN